MADPAPSVPFDTAAARADGVSDADIAAFLAPKLGFDLGAARKDGVSDSAIVDFLAPAAPVKAVAVPEPESGMLKGVGKAAAQTVGEIPGNIVRGFGAGVVSAGTGLLELDKRDTDATRQRIDLMDKIDRGEKVKPIKAEGLAAPADPQFEFAMKYMAAGEKGRGELRQKTLNEIAERQIEPGAEQRLGQSAKKVGGEIFGTGQTMNKAVQAAIPLTPEEERRPSVQFTRALTGLVGYVGAGAVGGLPGVIGYAGMESMGQTYEEAKAKGASDEDAAAAGVLNGMVQGGLMTIPVGQALKVMDRLSSAAKGMFVKAVVESAKSGATLTALAQIAQIADNAVAKSTYDPDRSLAQGLGEHLGPTFAAGAVLPVAGVAAARVANRFRPRPEDVAKPVMDAGTVDEAIGAAKSVVEGTPVDVDAIASRAQEYGGPPEQQQGKLLQLFGGLNRGTVEQAADGAFHFRTGEGETEAATPLKVWDEKAPRAEGAEPTIAPALAAAQRDHYGKLGIDIVYFENDAKIPFDGAMDPQNPNTIFLSNHPERNAAQVAAHEVTHALESTTLPDGTNLGDVLHSQIREGLTNEGLRHAYETFGKTAPERAAFPAGPEGDSAHADAVVSHLVRELGADIGGEAPRFQTFVPKVIEAVQQRYGVDAAKDVLGKLIAGIQRAMRTLREFFARPEEHAEYGQPETVSQNWVTNLGEVHDTLAKMYAERFGTQAEKENSALATMRDKAQRDRFARENPEPGAPEVPPPSMPEGFLEPIKPGSITPETQRPAIEEAHQRIVRMRRWLGELDEQRRTQAAASPQATFLKQTEAAILAKVRGVEERLTGAQASRLEKVRADLDALLNPTVDSLDMVRVRQALLVEQQRLAHAAAVGSPTAPMGGRSGVRPRTARERATEPMPAPVAEPIPEPVRAAESAPVAEQSAESAAAQPAEAPAAPIVRFRREAAEIESALPSVPENHTRLWRGNRAGEVGVNPQFTNDLPGIALPFRDAYGGRLSYVDVPTADLPKYLNRGVAADGAEFIVTKEIAASAKEAVPLAKPAVTVGDVSGVETKASARDGALATRDYATRRPLEALGFTWQHQFGEPVDLAGRGVPPAAISALERAGLADRGQMTEAQWDAWNREMNILRKEGVVSVGEARPEGDEPAPMLMAAESPKFSPKLDWVRRAFSAVLPRGEAWTEKAFNVYADIRAANPRDTAAFSKVLESALRRYDLPEADYNRFMERVGRLSLDDAGRLQQAVEQRAAAGLAYVPKEAAPASRRRGPVTDVEPIEQALIGQGSDPEVRFSPKPEEAPRSLEDVRAAWDAADIKNAVSEKNGVITLSQIVVPEAQRRQGIGTAAMKQLIDYADATDQRIALTPSADFGGTKSRLIEFYKSLGFIENKGRDIDHSVSETMIREPISDDGTKFSPKLTGESKERSYTPEERKAYENVGRAVEPFSLGQWLGETRQDLGKKLIAAALDPYIGVKENDPQGYLALRNANTSGGAVEVFKKYGTLKFDGSAYALDKRTGGVTELVKSLHAEAHDFLWWVAANRAERLAKEDRENLWTPEDIAVIKKTNRGNVEFDYELSNGKITRSREAIYADSLRKLDTLNRNVMDLAVEAGLLKRDAVNALWSNPFYVPFYRQAEDNGRFVGPSISSGFVKQNAFKTLKGGSEKLNNDLWENALGNWQHMIDASISNRASLGVLDVASTNAAGARPMTLQEVNHLSDKELKSRTVWVMKDGEKVHYEITDPLLFKAVSALDSLADPMHLMSMGRWFKRVLQVGVTSNPAFAVRNLIRDTQQTLAVAPSSFNVASTMAEGFRMNDAKGALTNLARAAAAREVRTLNLSDEAVNAIAGGATMRLVESTDTGLRDTKLSTMLDTPASVEGFRNYMATLGRAYKETVGQGEDVNRMALYHKLRAEGVPHDAASFAARDLADFTLSGAAAPVRYIIGVVPFLNARMQGLYKVGRSAVNADRAFSAEVGLPDKSSSGRLAVVLGTSALAMLALDSIYANDEDYKKRTEFDRNTYYWFKFGDAQIRIPMGFEIATLARMAANTAESFYDKEMTVGRLFQSYWQMLGQNLQMNPIPQVFAPLDDLRTNTSGTGQHIVPMGMEHLQPDQRYTANNTLAARGVSTAINSTLRAIPGVHAEGPSPVQLDYLVKAYGGWLATSSLGMADTVMRSFTSEPVRPAKDFWATATQGMVSTESSPQSRYIDMLYTQGKEIEQAYATYRDMIQRGQAEEAQRFFKDNRETLQKHGLISGLTRLEGDLNRQIRFITNNPDPKVTAEQKKIQIMQLQAMKSRAAEQVFGARPARGE